MSGTRPLPADWKKWPRDVGLGFSLSRGPWRVDMNPVTPPDALTHWEARVWRMDGDTPLPGTTIEAHDHWTCAAEVEAHLREVGS